MYRRMNSIDSKEDISEIFGLVLTFNSWVTKVGVFNVRNTIAINRLTYFTDLDGDIIKTIDYENQENFTIIWNDDLFLPLLFFNPCFLLMSFTRPYYNNVINNAIILQANIANYLLYLPSIRFAIY